MSAIATRLWAATYCNIGVVYEQMAEYEKAFEYHKKEIETTVKVPRPQPPA